MSGLSVIVPATDAPPTLDACLSAIEASARAPDEVIVVRDPARCGPAEARNDAAGSASGEILVFVDADVVVHTDALARIEERLTEDPGLVAVFGAYDDAPAARGVVSRFRNLLHHHVHSAASGPASTFWAGLGAVRRRAFLDAGGFDAALYPVPSIEDVELGVRLCGAGGRILLDPSIRGTHLKRWTLRGMVATDLCRRGVPWVRLLLRGGATSTALNLGWRHRASALACIVLVLTLVTGRPRIAAGALASLVVLNHRLYALLVRRMGVAGAAGGVALHVVHHLTGVAAVPVALVGHLRAGRVRRGD